MLKADPYKCSLCTLYSTTSQSPHPNPAHFLALENVPLSLLFPETWKLSLSPLFYFSHPTGLYILRP